MGQSHGEPLGFLLYRDGNTAARRCRGAEAAGARLHPGLTSAELARGTNVSAQAMNQVLHALEDRGALTRPASTPAGRAMQAQLTRRGEALLKRADAAVHVADHRVLACFTIDEQHHLKQLLHAVGTRDAEHLEGCRNP
jgi:DNA-binding MarR family transcriptional regulator